MAEKHHTDWKPALGRCSSAVGPALLFVIVVCFFWKLTLTNQYTWLGGAETANQLLPSYQFQADLWHSRQFPLWDPYSEGGQPIFGRTYSGAAYPPNWLLFLAPLRRGWIRQSYLHWYFVLIHFQGALFCYWLCRDLNRSRAASLLSALAFALGGFLGTTNSPAMLNGAVWAPLVLMFFVRMTRSCRPVASSACSGAFLGITFLSGDPQIPVLLCFMMAGLWLYQVVTGKARQLRFFLIFSLFVLLVGALQTLPMYAYGNFSSPISEDNSLYPQSLLGVVIPGFFRKGDPFVGLTAFLLALLGVAAAWGERTVRVMAAISLGGLLYALGSNSVFHGILHSVVPTVRDPVLAIFVFHFGLCVLVAYGIDCYKSVDTKLVVGLLCGFSAVVGLIMWIMTAAKAAFDDRLGVALIAGLLLALIFSAWSGSRLSNRAAIPSLGLLMLFELGNITTYDYQALQQGTTFLSKLSEHYDIAGFLRDQTAPVRVEAARSDIPYNFGDWYGIDYFGENPQAIYGVNFQIAMQATRPNQVEVFKGQSGLKVFRDPAALSVVRMVHEALPGFHLESCREPETADLVTRRPDYLVVEANLKCRGMLIEADTFAPGWEAVVDGRSAVLYEVYGRLRGVVVDAGPHRVEMRYRPKAIYWGATLSAFGLLGACALARTDA